MPEQDVAAKAPVVFSIDIGELMRTLGEMKRDLDGLRRDVDDLMRREVVDAKARSDIATIQATLAGLTIDWTAITNKPLTFPAATHGNEKHDAAYLSSVSWNDVGSKPTTFTPSQHGNEAHSATYITGVAWGDVTNKPTTFPPDAHNHDSVYVGKTNYNNHSHQYSDNGVPYQTGTPSIPA